MRSLLTRLLPWYGARRFRVNATRAFRFLCDEHGFGDPEFQTDVFGDTLTYLRNDVAVRVILDKQDRYLEAYVIRLRNGHIPLLVEEPQDSIYLSNLLAIRVPQLKPAMREKIDAGSGHLPGALSAAASALREHGKDALAGDPSIFDEVARRYPQPRGPRHEWFTRETLRP